MKRLYPLRFTPILRQYIWGGRKLGEVFGKAIGSENDYAESWELVDRLNDQSHVANGDLAGTPLEHIVRDFGPELLGKHHPLIRFPLLIKLLDANQLLSVQVHPNDLQAACLTPPDLGKTEAWYVLHAEPGSKIYAGLKRGFDRAAFEREVVRGTCELCLNSFEPKIGDVVYIPAGTVHALGAGVVILEIQQASDTTFRLFDWNRVGKDGQPRPLHVEKALNVIDFNRGPVEPIRIASASGNDELIKSPYFEMRRIKQTKSFSIEEQSLCRMWTVIEGKMQVNGEPSNAILTAGQTVVIPAAWSTIEVRVLEPVTILEVTLP